MHKVKSFDYIRSSEGALFHCSVTRKQLFISKGSELGSDLDQSLDRPISERALSGFSDSGRFTSPLRASSEITAPNQHMTPPISHQQRQHRRHGRPPADLSPSRPLAPRTLAPLSQHRNVINPRVRYL